LFIGLALIWRQLHIPSLIAVSTLLTLLLWAKMSEISSSRDSKFIWFILLHLLAVNALLLPTYQVPIMIFGMALLIWVASYFSQVLSFVNSNTFGQTASKAVNKAESNLRSMAIAKQLSLLTVISLHFAIVLFITLPRINLPMQELGLAMGLPIMVEVDKSKASKGLGKELSFNAISEQGQSNSRVLLASLPSNFIQSAQTPLYWRGPVYWRYVSKDEGEKHNETWQLREGFNIRSKRQYNGFGSNKTVNNIANQRENTFEYSVILMPHGEYWLYGLDLPQSLTGESYLSQDYQLLSIRKVTNMWRYNISSSLTYQISEKEPKAQLTLGLQYPNNNPKIKALGQQWQQEFAQHNQPEHAIISKAIQYFSQGKYLYASDSYQYQGGDQLDQFMFTRKVGYSQHYASALTLLLRAAKIPARLVAGYRGAEQVGLTNMYAVNEHHAHAWVEAYIASDKNNSNSPKHWQRIDPALWLSDYFTNGTTENSQEDEIELQAKANLNKAALAQTPQNQPQINHKILEKNSKHSKSTSWLNSINQWTLDFDAKKQSQLAKTLGIKKLLWWHLVFIALACILLFSALYYITLRLMNRGKKLPEHLIVYHKLCKKLTKKGIKKYPYEGAKDYFRRCTHEQPNVFSSKQMHVLTQQYLILAYSKLTKSEFKTHLQAFKTLAEKV